MWISFLLFSILLFLSAEAEQLKLNLSAQSAILINADTGAILFEKDKHEKQFPASTTKIATAWYFLEHQKDKLDELTTVPADCVSVVHASVRQAAGSTEPSYRLEHDGTKMGIKRGETVSLRDLLYGLMLPSGNDAANVIAHYVSGSIPKFVENLNLFLREKGIHNTHFTNPHGLPDPEHYTTAYDLALMAQQSMKDPLFREIVRSVRYTRPRSNLQEEHVLLQHNRILKPGRYYYPKAVGIKIGYTSKAGATFVGAAEHEGRTLIAVLLKTPSFDKCYSDAIALFEAAFSQSKVIRTLFAKGYDQFSIEMKGAKQRLGAVLSEDLKIEYYPAEEPEFKAFVKWNEDLKLPIQKGALVGELQLLTPEQKVLKSAPIYAIADVEKTFFNELGALFCHPFFKGTVILLMIALSLFFYSYRKQLKNRFSTPPTS
jgi:D-alanyl-D-alanine carboxypeptidase (penicillin-binding protein 5/6)